MTVPLSSYEQTLQTRFVPDHTFLVLFGMSKYTHVWTRDASGALKQALNNLPYSSEDCEILKHCLLKHHIQPENIYGSSKDPTSKDFN